MTTPTTTEQDEAIRTALILQATAIADRLNITNAHLRRVTDAVIDNGGTTNGEGLCRLCVHDHSIRSREPDELDAFRPSHSDFCECDLPQVEALETRAAHCAQFHDGPPCGADLNDHD